MNFICIICRDVLKSISDDSKDGNQMVIVATKCGHLFHLPCLSNWFRQCWKLSDSDSHPRCPCCKTLSYVHELVRLYPAQEATCSVAITPSISEGRTRISPSELSSATAQVSTSLTALKKNHKVFVDDLQTLERTNSTENGIFHDKSIITSETLQEDMKKLHDDFEELSILCKSSEVRWETHQEKQRQEIIYLKHQNEKLVREIKCQIRYATSRNQECSNDGDDDDSIKKSAIEPEDQSTNHYNEDNYVYEPAPFREANEWQLPTSTNVTASQNFPSRVIVNREDTSIKPGDKVVWVVDDKPEAGVVKWKGFVGSRIYAGIEFERQLGIPIGDVHTDSLQCIFRFKSGHGRLVPAQELIRYEQYYSDMASKIKSRKLSFQKLKSHSCTQQ